MKDKYPEQDFHFTSLKETADLKRIYRILSGELQRTLVETVLCFSVLCRPRQAPPMVRRHERAHCWHAKRGQVIVTKRSPQYGD